MDVLTQVPFIAELSFCRAVIEKHSVPSGVWIVEGYASTSDLDSQNHIVTPEAIKMGAECLRKYDTVLFNHDVDRPIGKVNASEAQDGKLLVKVAISKTEPKIWEQIKDGTLSKFSIRGFITDSEYYTDERSVVTKNILLIKGMEIHEISIVSVPANPEARSLNWYIEKSLKKDSVAMDAIEKDQKSFESAIKNLEAGLTDIQGEDHDQVETIIRSLTALIGRVYQKADQNKGGKIVDKEEVKKEEAVTEPVKEEVKVESKEEVKKSDEVATQKVELDVSALTAVITQLQDMVKSVTTQSEEVKAGQAEVAKAQAEITQAKTDIAKSISDLNALLKEIPIRKGQPAPAEVKTEEVEVKKDLSKDENFQKAKPADQLHMLIESVAV